MGFTSWNTAPKVLIHKGTVDDGKVDAIQSIVDQKMPDYRLYRVVVLAQNILVDLRAKDDDSDMMEWHYVDLDRKYLSGNIPSDTLFSSDEFKKALKNARIINNDVLAHHGVKGQKWGVRHWQNSDGSLTPAGREHYGYGKADKTVYKGRVGYEVKSGVIGIAAGLASAIPGVGPALTALGWATKGKQAVDSLTKTFSSEEKANEQFKKVLDIDTKITSEKDCKKIEGEHSSEQDLAAINPLRNSIMSSTGSTNNCFLCTTAYDLRRRGYDVGAKAGFGRTQSDILRYYKGAKVEKANSKNWKEFESKLNQYPDGARGNLMVKSFSGGGHSMIWEKANGQIKILDAQVNKTKKMTSFGFTSTWDVSSASFARTDNCEINWAAMSDCVANRKR